MSAKMKKLLSLGLLIAFTSILSMGCHPGRREPAPPPPPRPGPGPAPVPAPAPGPGPGPAPQPVP